MAAMRRSTSRASAGSGSSTERPCAKPGSSEPMQPDYIVVGAGAAGCIVAARLSEDPSVRVLLIEAGGSDRNPIITMPGALPFVYERRQLQWGYQSGPEPQLGGRTIDEKLGQGVGGSTSINAMIWNRGNPPE